MGPEPDARAGRRRDRSQPEGDRPIAHCPLPIASLMNSDQLRQALGELNGERSVTFAVTGMPNGAEALTVHSAMLIPTEADNLVKLTDGQCIYIVEADRIAWIRIALGKGNLTPKPHQR